MKNPMIPEDYHSALNLHDTQVGIKTVKDFFQGMLAERLNLLRVSAPLFVDPASGLNDNLNGVERPVSFDILEQDGIVYYKRHRCHCHVCKVKRDQAAVLCSRSTIV